jgi:SagB-type dehydrogenase family enzyme
MTNKIGREFIEKTKFQYIDISDQMKGLPQPPLESGYDKNKKIINLPNPKHIKTDGMDLRNAIENRRSIRNYSNQPLTIEELSFLLWCTQGIREIYENISTFRNVPSAGARHAIETYIFVNNIKNLKPGLYRFLAVDYNLLEIDVSPSIPQKITQGCLGQDFVTKSAVTFIWAACGYRMTWRYNERGYRYLFLDAGHVCQNLYLSAESIGCGVCAIAAFLDDDLNQVLNIDGNKQFVIYIATVGKKPMNHKKCKYD